MYHEFGSEFWIDEKHRTGQKKQHYLFEAGEILTSSGRASLSLALEQMENLPHKALLPTYTCMTVTKPFAEYGFEVLYYDINQSMQPDLSAIMEATRAEPVIFVHMGHFGFPTNESLRDVFPLLRERGCVILEDTTHSLFYEGEPFDSDCRAASLRKWLGIPSGGVVFPDRFSGLLHAVDAPPFDGFYRTRELAMKEKGDIMEGRSPVPEKAEYLTRYGDAEEMLHRDIKPYSIDERSLDILATTDFTYLRRQRRENYLTLLELLPRTPEIRPVFPVLPPECCPLFFPVCVDMNNREYQKQLAARKLFCPIHWPSNPYIHEHYAGLAFWETHILSIPCDQRYQREDMEKVVQIVTEVFTRS